MRNYGLKILKKLWPFAAVAVGYTLIANFDTFDPPTYLWDSLRLVSLIVSFIAGFMLFTILAPLIIIVKRLIQRKHPGKMAIWCLFIGALFFFDYTTRFFLLNLQQERSIRKAQSLIVAIEQYRSDIGSYPESTESLVPEYIEKLPKPIPANWSIFRYQNLDSTYQLDFSLWEHGRKYRVVIYTPSGMNPDSEYTFIDTDSKNWKWHYY